MTQPQAKTSKMSRIHPQKIAPASLIPKVMTTDRREPSRAFRWMCFCLALQ
jgi:hypothetical protein